MCQPVRSAFVHSFSIKSSVINKLCMFLFYSLVCEIAPTSWVSPKLRGSSLLTRAFSTTLTVQPISSQGCYLSIYHTCIAVWWVFALYWVSNVMGVSFTVYISNLIIICFSLIFLIFVSLFLLLYVCLLHLALAYINQLLPPAEFNVCLWCWVSSYYHQQI